jgi:hypothetical protein
VFGTGNDRRFKRAHGTISYHILREKVKGRDAFDRNFGDEAWVADIFKVKN